MASDKIELGVLEPAELSVRESIVLPYIARQEALFLRTGYRFNEDTSPNETFERTQDHIRTLYAEPAGKLALSENLWQRGSVDLETGTITWEFRRPEQGKRLANRLESVLAPAGEPVLPRIERIAQDEAAQHVRQKKPNIMRVVQALQRIWTQYGALEEDHRAAQTEMPFIQYVFDSRAQRFPEFWYQEWRAEDRYTTKTYVAEDVALSANDEPELDPDPKEPKSPKPDLTAITRAITLLPDHAAEVIQNFLTARQNSLSHAEFSDLLGTNSREATMRLAAAFQEAADCLEPTAYEAITAIRYV